jgi:outer membrane lipoprotein-sorting protein
MNKNIIYTFSLFLILLASVNSTAYAQDAKQIMIDAEQKLRGISSKGEMKMTIQRPTWSREIGLKFWTKGEAYSLMLLTAPARDKGTSFLKREKEIWNWQPSIDRTVKLPPSMMMQSWMGSDFTNDDLVKSSSIINDYTHNYLGEEEVIGRPCHVIELIPDEDAPVVWGKVKTWVDKDLLLQLKTEFYDEDEYLINTLLSEDIKEMGGRTIPTKLTIVPAEDEEQKTIIEYIDIDFDADIKDGFFSIQNMKRVQ